MPIAGMRHIDLALDVHGLCNGCQHAMCSLHGLLGRAFGQKQHKLVTRQATNQVACAQALREPPCHLAQQSVASSMPLGVVDLFEPIQVYKQHRARLVVALQISQRALCAGAEHRPIGQPCEHVKKRQLMDALSCGVAFDGHRAQVQARVHKPPVQRPRAARLSKVESESPDHLAPVVEDGAGPAGLDATRLEQVLVVCPAWVGGDVCNHHGLAGEGRRTA